MTIDEAIKEAKFRAAKFSCDHVVWRCRNTFGVAPDGTPHPFQTIDGAIRPVAIYTPEGKELK